MPGLTSPLADTDGRKIDFWIVRENVEGEYSEIGGRIFAGTDRETVVQESVFTRIGVDRIVEYAFRLAERKGLAMVTSPTSAASLDSSPVVLGDAPLALEDIVRVARNHAPSRGS